MIEQAILAAWESVQTQSMPPSEAILLWQNHGSTVYIDDDWGPSVPYPPADHEDGTRNNGYRSLKGNEQAVYAIPEAQGCPALQRFLVQLNRLESPVETVGCEQGFFPIEGHESIQTSLGSYTDIMFSDPRKNAHLESFIRLAAHLVAATDGCEQRGGTVEIGFHLLRRLDGCDCPWGLMLRVGNVGRSEAEAQQLWEETLARLGAAIGSLSNGFPN